MSFRIFTRNRPATVVSCVNFSRLGYRFNTNSTKAEIVSKYKQKLEEKAKALGLNNIDELQEKLKVDIETKKKELNAIDPLKELEEYERRQAEEVIRKKDSKTIKVRSPIPKETPKLPYKTLHSYIDVDKTKELSKEELEFVWRARFQNKDRNLHAILNNLQFATMYVNAFKNPSFILPLPKNEDGYEMHFVQWSFVGPKTTHCMLTTVAEYKLHKEYAKPHTTLMFHQDLAESTDLVLMNGQVETDVPLNLDEAQLLVLNIQRFYGGQDDTESSKRKLALLRNFTSGDPDFKIEDLISEATALE